MLRSRWLLLGLIALSIHAVVSEVTDMPAPIAQQTTAVKGGARAQSSSTVQSSRTVQSVSILRKPSYSHGPKPAARSQSREQEKFLRVAKKKKEKTLHHPIPEKPLVFKHYKPPVKRYRHKPVFKKLGHNPVSMNSMGKERKRVKKLTKGIKKAAVLKDVTPKKWYKRKPAKWRKFNPTLAKTLAERNSKAAAKVPSSLNLYYKPKSFYRQRTVGHLLKVMKRMKAKRETLYKQGKVLNATEKKKFKRRMAFLKRKVQRVARKSRKLRKKFKRSLKKWRRHEKKQRKVARYRRAMRKHGMLKIKKKPRWFRKLNKAKPRIWKPSHKPKRPKYMKLMKDRNGKTKWVDTRKKPPSPSTSGKKGLKFTIWRDLQAGMPRKKPKEYRPPRINGKPVAYKTYKLIKKAQADHIDDPTNPTVADKLEEAKLTQGPKQTRVWVSQKARIAQEQQQIRARRAAKRARKAKKWAHRRRNRYHYFHKTCETKNKKGAKTKQCFLQNVRRVCTFGKKCRLLVTRMIDKCWKEGVVQRCKRIHTRKECRKNKLTGDLKCKRVPIRYKCHTDPETHIKTCRHVRVRKVCLQRLPEKYRSRKERRKADIRISFSRSNLTILSDGLAASNNGSAILKKSLAQTDPRTGDIVCNMWKEVPLERRCNIIAYCGKVPCRKLVKRFKRALLRKRAKKMVKRYLKKMAKLGKLPAKPAGKPKSNPGAATPIIMRTRMRFAELRADAKPKAKAKAKAKPKPKPKPKAAAKPKPKPKASPKPRPRPKSRPKPKAKAKLDAKALKRRLKRKKLVKKMKSFLKAVRRFKNKLRKLKGRRRVLKCKWVVARPLPYHESCCKKAEKGKAGRGSPKKKRASRGGRGKKRRARKQNKRKAKKWELPDKVHDSTEDPALP